MRRATTSSSRSTSAAPRWCARPRRTSRTSRSSSRPSRTRRSSRRCGAGGTTLTQRRELAARAFAHTCEYDRAVATWFAEETLGEADLPQHLTIKAERLSTLRYGENSHQRAAIYTRVGGHGIAQATQLQGKEMSYNNYVDADAALRAAFDMVKPAVAIIKHANPCGIAVAAPNALDPIASAHLRAHECDPVSAFGGVIAANRTVTLKMAENLRDIFTEVIVAPDFEPAALEVFELKKNLRVLQLPADWQQERMDVRLVSGGLLLQDADRFPDDIESVAKDWQLVSGERPDDEEMTNLIFAWKACRAVKSNAIVLAKGSATVGIGMGQVNRVDSCRLAVERAGDRAAGSVAASDAFFPFADGPAGAARRGHLDDRPARRLGARRRGHRRRAQGRRHDVLHRGAPLLPLIPSSPRDRIGAARLRSTHPVSRHLSGLAVKQSLRRSGGRTPRASAATPR